RRFDGSATRGQEGAGHMIDSRDRAGDGKFQAGKRTVSTERSAMNDDTRKLLKIFGVAVTDAEAEADRLVARVGQLSTDSSKEEIAALLKDGAELCRELN